MKKYLNFCLLLGAIAASSAAHGAITFQNFAIIGMDVDDEEFQVVALDDVSAGEVVFFTDEEWTGTEWSSGEGFVEWTTPELAAGDVATLTTSSSSAGGTVSVVSGTSFVLSNGGDGLWAYQTADNTYNGTDVSHLYAVGEDNPDDFGTFTGTVLTSGNGATVFNPTGSVSSNDGGYYSGTRENLSAEGFIAAIGDAENWTFATSSLPDFNDTPFTVVPEPSHYAAFAGLVGLAIAMGIRRKRRS